MAGLGAARALADQGIEPVVIEARDRIGGRVDTVDWEGTKIDLGAAWIHDSRGNPLTTVARNAGLELIPTSYDRVSLRTPSATAVPASRVERMMRARDSIISALYRQARSRPAGPMAPALKTQLAGRRLTRAERSALDWLLGVEIPLDLAADPSQLSLDGFYEGETWDGGPDVMVRGGASQLVSAVAEGIDVKTGQAATAVRQLADSVQVLTSRGTIEADGCVVTVPLGVMKAGTIRFDPPLPSSTRRAVSRVGFGLLEKSFLSYGQPWWPGSATQVGTVGQPLARTASAFPLERLTGKPILCGFTGGTWAATLEREGRTVEAVIAQLRAGFGPAADTSRTLSTRWLADPFSRGAYSHLPPGVTASSRRDLGRLHGRVILAGEHTSVERPSTMDGAWLAGRAAARRLARDIG